VRLQKWLAEAGHGSRREAETWITAGRLTINGVVATLGNRVARGDTVCLDGQAVVNRRQERQVILLHKSREVMCTRKDPEGRRTVFDLLVGPEHDEHTWIPLRRLVTIGRLDYNSEGVLLLTNDGMLAHRLMHPSGGVERVYRVRVHGIVEEKTLARMRRDGVVLDDGPTGPLPVTLDRVIGTNSWLTLSLREGRNRIVRRIFESMSMPVTRLMRVSYAGVELGDLPPGRWRFLAVGEIARLRYQAGLLR
jgi:23S rRNA pseudouridine2605 synthase